MKKIHLFVAIIFIFSLCTSFCVLANEAYTQSIEPLDESVAENELSGSEMEANDQSSTVECIIKRCETGSEYLRYCNNNPLDTDKLVIILIPIDFDAYSFINNSQWDSYCSTCDFSLAVLQFDWENDPEKARTYYEDVYTDLMSDTDCEEKSVFIIGYDTGAQFAPEEVCIHHDRYTGLVTFGNYGLSEMQIQTYSSDYKSWNMNVWIASEKNSTLLKNNVAFWKKMNNITAPYDSSYNVAYADYLYIPMVSTAGKINPDDSGIGLLYFDKEDDYYSKSTTSNICKNFIGVINNNTAKFSGTITGGELFPINDYRFSYYRQEYKGAQRDYWMYVASSYNEEGDGSPLIICLHGNYGNGSDMIVRTRWNNVAEENNCIVVFPTSLFKGAFQHYWQDIDEEMSWLRSLIDTVCESYNVDMSRIYVTGYSNGAGMAQNLAINFSDIIAAAGMGAPIFYEEDYFGTPDNFYPVAAVYSIGTEDSYLKKYNYTAAIDDDPAESHLMYWRMMFGFEQDEYSLVQTDELEIYTFSNQDDIPVCSWVVVNGKGHTYPQEEVRNMWDFMSQYTKDKDGKLYCNGELTEQRRD